jgi:hypothetical protein
MQGAGWIAGIVISALTGMRIIGGTRVVCVSRMGDRKGGKGRGAGGWGGVGMEVWRLGVGVGLGEVGGDFFVSFFIEILNYKRLIIF